MPNITSNSGISSSTKSTKRISSLMHTSHPGKNLFINYTSLTGVNTVNGLFNTSNLISKHKAKDGDAKEYVAPESNNTTTYLE